MLTFYTFFAKIFVLFLDKICYGILISMNLSKCQFFREKKIQLKILTMHTKSDPDHFDTFLLETRYFFLQLFLHHFVVVNKKVC